MNASESYRPRDNDIASEDFDGEFVVLDLGSGKYFSLAGSAAIVWRGLLAGHSVDTLSAGLAQDDARRALMTGLVETLLVHNLLVPAGTAEAGDPGIPAELAASAGGFGVDVFEDLADLLVADPIHDVDTRVGWPHKPAGND